MQLNADIGLYQHLVTLQMQRNTTKCIKMKPLLIVIIIFVFLTGSTLIASAQSADVQQYVDSLLNEAKLTGNDTTKYKLLAYASNALSRINSDEGLKVARQALELAEKMEYPFGIAEACNAMATNYKARSENAKAIEYLFKALKIVEQIGYDRGRCILLDGIGHIYMVEDNIGKAEEYQLKALDLATEISDTDQVMLTKISLGALSQSANRYDQAKRYWTEALVLSYELNDNLNAGIILNNLSAWAIAGKNYDSALIYAKQALEVSRATGDQYNIASCMGNIGKIYLEMKTYGKAITYLQQALAAHEAVGDLGGMEYTYATLADVYNATGNYKAAYEAKQKQLAVFDSLVKQSSAEQITKLELSSQYEKQQLADSLKNAEAKRLAAARLQKQRVFTFSGIGLAIVLTAFSVFIARERKKSDKLLLNILPAEVAKELKRKGEADAQLFDDVSVLFTDFVGFTKVSELLTPQQLVDELDNCFKAFDEITGKHGIEKIKTIGDAYLAVCGLPSADPLHAVKTVAAAKDIIAYMQQRRAQMGDRTFEVRIGIHSGEVVAGIVGVKKFAYDIWGDTVNTAARMESNSGPGKINISQTTYELVKDSYTCTYRGELEAKNKGMMKMYFVEG